MDEDNRTYERALAIIESRRRPRRPSAATAYVDGQAQVNGARSGATALRGTPSIVGMKEWLEQIGHSPDSLTSLKIIHVAGTKGKGSTCAFTESILRAHGKNTGRPFRTGLYTLPHLIYPEERMRLDSIPMNRSLFAKYFFELYDNTPQLHHSFDATNPDPVARGPRNLQLYFLLALHIFLSEKVDVAVIETHSGGEYDATNFILAPVVTAITTLGMDHIAMLGPTIKDIAWHKSGIFKPGAVALSTEQEAGEEVIVVLRERAQAIGEDVRFVGQDSRLPADASALEPAVQRKNASLAISVVEAWLKHSGQSSNKVLSREGIKMGIEQWSWPGRFQIVPEGRNTWFLDAAHNEMSIGIAAQWFAESSKKILEDMHAEPVRILIFSHINELRDPLALLRALALAFEEHKANVDHVIITSYDSHGKEDLNSNVGFVALKEVFSSIHPSTRVWDEHAIGSAIHFARRLGEEADMHALITGSQHLVGPALRILTEGEGRTVG
ncbi:hypothetical protein LTR78_004779 [Recurvomyces mirabilis]|uniref:tetrahydrofolate synthase n=1 Tax=Recurvomyces mirabilis TaxID=574656 RepID=A0AAE0WP34_9PEZI|nr:hypothetical protein LTR78_004779 [Recurvomyces mirabilis]KAK5157950.1 hypothetical protein LTS14_003873 [Recurvomyces mirabilis]